MNGLTLWQRVRLLFGARLRFHELPSTPVSVSPPVAVDPSKTDERTEPYFQYIAALRSRWREITDSIRSSVGEAWRALNIELRAVDVASLLDELDRMERVGLRATSGSVLRKQEADATLLADTHKILELRARVAALRDAVEPLARLASHYPEGPDDVQVFQILGATVPGIKVGDLRRARRLWEETSSEVTVSRREPMTFTRTSRT